MTYDALVTLSLVLMFLDKGLLIRLYKSIKVYESLLPLVRCKQLDLCVIQAI